MSKRKKADKLPQDDEPVNGAPAPESAAPPREGDPRPTPAADDEITDADLDEAFTDDEDLEEEDSDEEGEEDEPARADEPASEVAQPLGEAGAEEDGKGKQKEQHQAPAVRPPPDLAAIVEAIIFSSDKPLPAAKIAEIGQLGSSKYVREAVLVLNQQYEDNGNAFRIVNIAGGYQMQTQPQYGEIVSRLIKSRAESKLSRAAMETLAIVAYRQPVLRADIESIRGVACGEVLRGLMEKNLAQIVGRAEEIGRPLLYGTSRHFLEVFGLSGLEDLPNAEQLRMPAARVAPEGKPAEAKPAEITPAEGTSPQSAPATPADAPEPAPGSPEKSD